MAPFFFDHTGVKEPRELPGERGSRKRFHLTELFNRHRRPLFWPALGFLVGSTYPVTQVLRTFSLKALWVTLLVVCTLLLTRAFKVHEKAGKKEFHRKTHGKPQMSTVFVLIALGYFLGAARSLVWTDRALAAQDLVDGVEIKGQFDQYILQISDNPKNSPGFTTFTGKLKGYTVEKAFEAAANSPYVPFEGKYKDMGVRVSLFEELKAGTGDWIILKGKLSLPAQAKNPGEFDSRKYLLGKGVFLEFKGAVVRQKSGLSLTYFGEKGFATRGLFWGKLRRIPGLVSKYVEGRFDAAIPKEDFGEERAVLKALFLGDKKDLSTRDSDSFRTAGLYRFIVMAGFHVQFAALAVERLFRRRVKNLHLSKIAGLSAAFFLGSLSRWAVGPLRVFLCLGLRQGAFYLKRKYDVLSALAFCSLVIGWCVPFPLFNAAFQLSFSGMAAGWISGKYTETLAHELEIGIVRRYLVPSALMAAFLLPLLAAHFQDVSIAGFFLGALWAPLMAAVTFSALPLLCLPHGAARALGWVPFLAVKGLRRVGCMVARIPGASLSLPAPKLCEVLVYLGLLLALLHARSGGEERTGLRLFRRQNPRRIPHLRWRKALVLAFFSVFLALIWFRYYTPWPQVVFLSVGQGDSAVIRGRGVVILVDTGTETAARRVLVPYLKHEGIGRVDLCIISHLHEDHAGGLRELCGNVKVKTIMTCPGSEEGVAQILGEVFSLRSEKMNILEAGAGDVYQVGSSRIRVIHPLKECGTGRGLENEDSLVLGLSYDNLPLFLEFWGDAPGKSVRGLLDGTGAVAAQSPGYHLKLRNFPDYAKDVIPVVKVPHHGSPESLVHGFYERARGGMAVISVGPNSYGHPSPFVIEAAQKSGLEVFRTDVNGAVTLKTYPGKVRAFGFTK